MRNRAATTLLFTLGLFMFQSCVNLQHVQDYTKSSVSTLSKFEELKYTFNKHCTERCMFESARKNLIVREADCNCSIYAKADSVTFLLYNALHAYFDALNGLAEDKVTSYNFTSLQNALSENSMPVNGKMIEITTDQVTSYSKIASLLLKATTETYRKKKIHDFIVDANEPVKVLLAAFQNILSANLSGVLNFKKERFYVFYNEIVLDPSSSIYDKRKATMEYYEETGEIDNKQKQIETLVTCLKKISEGHDRLARSNLSAKEIRGIITPLSTDMKGLLLKFNKLKNS